MACVLTWNGCLREQVKTKGFHAESKDAEYDAYVLDEDAEDRLMDAMEPEMAKGGIIVDFHSCEFFPERWFDLVLVLRANNTVLYDRLAKRYDAVLCAASVAGRAWYLRATSVAVGMLTGTVLHNRGYSQLKLKENVEAEIMQVRATPAAAALRFSHCNRCDTIVRRWCWRKHGKATPRKSSTS